MKRLIDNYLKKWKNDPSRKPLILRGARQVGKTTAIRTLSRSFKSFVEINFEQITQAKDIFDTDLDPKRILVDISLLMKKDIIPGETLLFFDEVQACPKALIALRYFYEQMPELHIIAAGSLLEFAIEQVGVPVGRVNFLYVYPMSFLEFMWAEGEEKLMAAVALHDGFKPFSSPLHKRLQRYLGQYMAIGGMPEAVYSWQNNKSYSKCLDIHHSLIATYEEDFYKYATKSQIKYLQQVYSQLPHQLGESFRYSKISGDYRKRELAPAFELLKKACLISPITHTAGNGLPLGAGAHPNQIKVIMLDVALTQALLGMNSEDWALDPENSFINKGDIAEAFFGQEILAYSPLLRKPSLYYWQREKSGSQAEIDYLIALHGKIMPIEIKSGTRGTLKSLQRFIAERKEVEKGLCFSMKNYATSSTIDYYPLYAISAIVSQLSADE
jgi:predicted AAA+ superfamily ATPase